MSLSPFSLVLFPILMVAVGLIIAVTRRGKVAGGRLSSRLRQIETPLDPATTFERLAALGEPGSRYRLDDQDPDVGVLVLSSSPTLASWGFFHPVFISASPGGGAVVEIDIQSRLIQFGPIVSHHHKKCIAAVEGALSAPIARVVA